MEMYSKIPREWFPKNGCDTVRDEVLLQGVKIVGL